MANTLNLGTDGNWARKEGSLLAYNSENNNYKPLPFTFDRASSATRVNKDGLIEAVGADQPRIDYLNDSNGALLLEPSRTNLETKSNEFTAWGTNSNITRTANYIISPDGTLNGTRLQFTANGFCANTTQSLATYTISCYAKRNDSGTQNVGFFTNGSGVVNSAWEITSEWKRFSYTFPTLNGSFMGIAGDSGADISVYGFQIEGLVSYATSYIPTQGSAVTRLADSCYQGGLLDKGVLNNTALTLFFNSTLTSDTTNQFLDIISMHHSTASKEIRIESRTNNILYIQQGGVVNSGDNFNSLNLGSNSINFKKIAIVLTTTQFKVFADGSQIGSTLNGSYNVNFDSLGFQTFNGAVQTKIQNKEIKLYNTALSDSELQALTQV